ncbi:prolactin-8A7 isoform X1 [Rattus norvegicus]|uniref:Growth hormone d10 n=1 Tax=Rattus norvegicus TaxID=10116 RepID=A0A0G2JTQ7_RAT|nr:prolactin-8A7 isoform X1 [Rattus norvegicus]AAH98917.1 Prolactin family 8, subfamily a, member 7 [Rattus norvegicus]CDW51450.1 TPA: growth hormone d10 [Rattus norvegicus]|eukprot:XP_006253971.1 PREDICTED: prolactin-8A7 isoform X1 [Rattus norvegicus]
MELPLSQHSFSGKLLLLVVSSLLLWEKAASIPACLAEEGGCWNPLVETFNSAIHKAETLYDLANQIHVELYQNKFSSEQFSSLNSQVIRKDKTALRAGSYCHSTLINTPNKENEHINIEIKEYVKTLINFVGAWISPLYHLVLELSAMQDVPESILSKAKEIEENNRQLLDDLKWILIKVSPTEEMKEEFPSWEHLSFLKSSGEKSKFLAMFNLSNCLGYDAKYTLLNLRILKCLTTGKDC